MNYFATQFLSKIILYLNFTNLCSRLYEQLILEFSEGDTILILSSPNGKNSCRHLVLQFCTFSRGLPSKQLNFVLPVLCMGTSTKPTNVFLLFKLNSSSHSYVIGANLCSHCQCHYSWNFPVLERLQVVMLPRLLSEETLVK